MTGSNKESMWKFRLVVLTSRGMEVGNVIWEVQRLRSVNWVTGEGISSSMAKAGDVHDTESIAERLLLEAAKARVGDVIERAVTKYLQEGLVVYSNNQIGAAKDEVARLVQGINNGEGLTLNWGITGLSP